MLGTQHPGPSVIVILRVLTTLTLVNGGYQQYTNNHGNVLILQPDGHSGTINKVSLNGAVRSCMLLTTIVTFQGGKSYRLVQLV